MPGGGTYSTYVPMFHVHVPMSMPCPCPCPSAAPSTLLSAQVWVADQPGTVCAWEGEGGVDDMKAWRSVEAQAGMVWPVSQNDLPTGRG